MPASKASNFTGNLAALRRYGGAWREKENGTRLRRPRFHLRHMFGVVSRDAPAAVRRQQVLERQNPGRPIACQPVTRPVPLYR